jgi:hypothetical protein
MLSPFIFYLKTPTTDLKLEETDANDDGAGMIKLDLALLHIEQD